MDAGGGRLSDPPSLSFSIDRILAPDFGAKSRQRRKKPEDFQIDPTTCLSQLWGKHNSDEPRVQHEFDVRTLWTDSLNVPPSPYPSVPLNPTTRRIHTADDFCSRTGTDSSLESWKNFVKVESSSPANQCEESDILKSVKRHFENNLLIDGTLFQPPRFKNYLPPNVGRCSLSPGVVDVKPFRDDNQTSNDEGGSTTDDGRCSSAESKLRSPHRNEDVSVMRSKSSEPSSECATSAAADTVTDIIEDSRYPIWIHCTRYTSRVSSGPRSRRQGRRTRTGEEKRSRTAFSGAQLARLRQEFAANPYLSEARRAQLAGELGLSEMQAKIWFQNRRAKQKRGQKSPLAIKLMEHGLYNHSTVSKSDS